MSTFTYARLEDRIRNSLDYPPGHDWSELLFTKPELKRAIEIFNDQREAADLPRLSGPPAEGMWILSPQSSITKLEKDSGVDLFTLAGLALAPDTVGGVDVCPHSGACVNGCVAYAGNGRWDRTTNVRTARKMLLTNSPSAFFTLLLHDLDKLVRRHPEGVACRLNAFSDIRWERVLPKWFWQRYANVRFYDYTKHPLASRPMRTMPENYRLTYSWSEKSTKGAIVRNISAGRNVAVVLTTPGGKDRRTGQFRPIPSRVGPIPMIDGDVDDRRYADPTGVIVGLRRKGTLAADSPFVFKYDPVPS